MTIFVHDCKACRDLGSFDDPEHGHLDLYWCVNPSYRNLDSLLARYGDDGPEYVSAHPPEAFSDPVLLLRREWYREILRRGEAAGLYVPNPVPPAGSDRIEKTEGVCGGRARVAGTRIPVWSLVEWGRLGMSDDEVLESFPSLTPEDLAAVRSYAASHAEEIEQDIRDNRVVDASQD